MTRPDAAASLALALGAFWERRGHWAEGLDWFDEIAAAPDLDPALRARCLHFAGRMARLQNDADAALDRLQRASELGARRHRHRARRQGSLRSRLRTALALQSDYSTAQAHLGESLALFRAAGDDAGTADALSKLGLLAYYQADLGRAQQACDEALAIAKRRGDPLGDGRSAERAGPRGAPAATTAPRRRFSRSTWRRANGSTTSTG